MSEVTIDKNVPMPRHQKQGRSVYPWRDLEVGDSFVIRNAQSNPMPPHDLILSGQKFKKLTVVEHGKKVGRIWRIK